MKRIFDHQLRERFEEFLNEMHEDPVTICGGTPKAAKFDERKTSIMKHTKGPLPIYTVQIENLATQEFESINAAIDYAARHVYLAPRHLDMLEAALRGGQEYTYEYGFKAVTLSASAKEIPKDLIAAAPELLSALKAILKHVDCFCEETSDSRFGCPIHAAEDAIKKAEGK